jgi:transketolase
MREGFQQGIMEAAHLDTKVHLLTGDHGYALFDSFVKTFPNRFHNVGVSEANMVGIAAGFARNGLRPLIYGLAAFVPNRVFEFIKLQIALDEIPVVIVGDGAGLVYSTLGSSHQTLEDLAIIGTLPQLITLSPGSDREMKDAVLWSFNQNSPVYIRMGKSGGNYVGGHDSGLPQPTLLSSHEAKAGVAVVAHGSMVSETLKAKSHLPENKIDYWSCPSIFPLNTDFLNHLKKAYKKVFVVEEHQVRGGLASEVLMELRGSGVTVHPVCAIMPGHKLVGNYEWNLERHGLSSQRIAERIVADL